MWKPGHGVSDEILRRSQVDIVFTKTIFLFNLLVRCCAWGGETAETHTREMEIVVYYSTLQWHSCNNLPSMWKTRHGVSGEILRRLDAGMPKRKIRKPRWRVLRFRWNGREKKRTTTVVQIWKVTGHVENQAWRFPRGPTTPPRRHADEKKSKASFT